MTCALCTTDVPVTVPAVIDGVEYRICSRCENEHPRDGGYSFDGGAATNQPATNHNIRPGAKVSRIGAVRR